MIEEVIYLSIKNKIKIVEKDEKENHDRMILNFGHTLAHPFESINQLSGIYHGEAVANGMLYMIDDKCLKKEVFDIISSMQINLIKEYDLNQVMDYLENDKKTNGEEINVILVNKVGQGQIIKISFKDLKDRIRGEKNELMHW